MKTTRRETLKMVSLGLTAAVFPINRFMAMGLEQDFSTELIRNNVGMFHGRGGTIGWLINKEGIAVVDSQFPEFANKMIGFIEEKSDKGIDFLFNTHHHGDHTAGNISFKNKAAKVVAHANSKINQEKTASSRGNTAEQLLPDTTFADSWTGKAGDESITLTYFGAAHTNGDAVVHFENANVAHVGDLVFNRRHPYIDRPAGANIDHWITVLSDIRKHYDKDTIFICGHAGNGYEVKCNMEDLKAKEDYLEKLLKVVKAQVKAGKTEEQVLALTEIPGVSWQDDNIQRPLKAAYEEVIQNK